jgi:hypothetical protein
VTPVAAHQPFISLDPNPARTGRRGHAFAPTRSIEEAAMKTLAYGILLAGSVAAGALPAFAQADLSPEQRKSAYESVIKQKTPEPHRPPAFNVSRGDQLPSSVQSYDFPVEMTDPSVRQYQYIVINNQVLLIDPATRRIVEVVR